MLLVTKISRKVVMQKLSTVEKSGSEMFIKSLTKWIWDYAPCMKTNLRHKNKPHSVTAFWWCRKLCIRQQSTVHLAPVSWTLQEQRDRRLPSVQGPALPAEPSDDSCITTRHLSLTVFSHVHFAIPDSRSRVTKVYENTSDMMQQTNNKIWLELC